MSEKQGSKAWPETEAIGRVLVACERAAADLRMALTAVDVPDDARHRVERLGETAQKAVDEAHAAVERLWGEVGRAVSGRHLK